MQLKKEVHPPYNPRLGLKFAALFLAVVGGGIAGGELLYRATSENLPVIEVAAPTTRLVGPFTDDGTLTLSATDAVTTINGDLVVRGHLTVIPPENP